PPVTLLGGSMPVQALAYGLDGRVLIAGEPYAEPLLLGLRADGSPGQPQRLAGYGVKTSVIAFCPDGCGRFVTAGDSNFTAKLGNLNALEAQPIGLQGQRQTLAASFDRAGRSLVTVSAGGAVREWDPSDHEAKVVKEPKLLLQVPIASIQAAAL